MKNTEIKTPKKFYEITLKEKGSTFIGQIFPVDSPEKFEKRLDEVKKKYYDATHHCYAYRLLDGTFKYSDDGEPNGTAGIRIYNAIKHHKTTNILAVVIRYYGGTKLGVGPLGKAYYETCNQALSKAEYAVSEFYSKIKIYYDYQHTNIVHHTLNKFSALSIENTYENIPIILCLIKPDKTEEITSFLTENSAASIEIETIEENILVEKK